jgi:hypothetical protein
MAVDKGQFAGTDRAFFQLGKLGGINTQSPRESIRDEQFGWLENLMPVADGNYRALYSNAAAIYTTTPPRTIIYHYEYNITGLTTTTQYAAVFLDDGTAYQVELDNGAVTTISSVVGTFYPNSAALNNPLPQCVQNGRSGIIIVNTPPSGNGYYYWDGVNLYQGGTLAPMPTITNPGSGYDTPPTVTFTGGSGHGASATATIGSDGTVTGVNVTNPGSGYLVSDTPPTVVFTGGNHAGSGATLTAHLSSNPAGTGATLINANWQIGGYFGGNLIVTGGIQTFNAVQLAFTVGGGGSITGVRIVSGGNYQVQPTLSIGDISGFSVTSVTGTPTGTLYGPNTKIKATAGGTPYVQATIVPTVTAGVITATTINNGGFYGTNVAPTLTVSDTAVTATATVALMPFGIQGTCVEMYQSRAWIGNGPNIYFSASQLPFDFATGDGAGAFQSNDSFLKREFTVLKTLGPFLYLFGDSSINTISNVQQSGSPLVVTFNNQNVNSQSGTPWHDSVVAIEEALIFANSQGVFRLRGSNVDKISDDLDGIFQAANATLIGDTAPNQPTAALMQLNNKLVYMLVVPVQGPLDVSPRNALVMWDQTKWWVGSQVMTLQSVGTQEVNSIVQAWGNSGTTLNAMFTTPSGSLIKTWQSKLWSAEGLFTAKQIMRLYTMALDKSSGGYTFTGTFDFRLDNGAAVTTQAFTITQTNLTGSGSQNATVRGNYVGVTLHTTKDDFLLINHSLLYQEQSPMP